MKQAIHILKFVHLAFLVLALSALAVIPFFYHMTTTTAFVIMPLLFVLITMLSVFIDQVLNSWSRNIKDINLKFERHTKNCSWFKSIGC